MKQKLKSIYGNLVLFLSFAAIFAALNPTTMLGQTSGVGADGYTRVLWQGSDSSIEVWILDGSLNFVSGTTAGPIAGWIPIGLTVGSDNYTRVIWKSTYGQLAVWMLDPSLNLVAGNVYGPYVGWLPDSTSIDSADNQRVVWSHTQGFMAVWIIAPDLSVLGAVGYPNAFGYTPAGQSATMHRMSVSPAKISAPGSRDQEAGRLAPESSPSQQGHPLPKELTPQFHPLTAAPKAAQ